MISKVVAQNKSIQKSTPPMLSTSPMSQQLQQGSSECLHTPSTLSHQPPPATINLSTQVPPPLVIILDEDPHHPIDGADEAGEDDGLDRIGDGLGMEDDDNERSEEHTSELQSP